MALLLASHDAGDTDAGVSTRVDEPARMEDFLRSVERRGFLMARVALGNEDDALDALQDAMLQLLKVYGERPAGEWRPLFYRILRNRITDTLRRRRVAAFFFAKPPARNEAQEGEPLEELPDPAERNPERLLAGERRAQALLAALARLPQRQQEAFMLRCWEGLSTADTARAMRCSEGSVKTHYFRALQALRTALEDQWP